MNSIQQSALFFTTLTVFAVGFPAAAAIGPDAEMQLVISQWGTDLQQQNFTDLRGRLEKWTTRDFTFNSQTGLRALDRLIASEKQDLASVQKTQQDFEKQYHVKLHLGIRFEPVNLGVLGDIAIEDAALAYRVPASGKKKMPNGMVQGEAGDLGHSETYHLTWTRTPLGWKIRSLKIRPNPMIGTVLFIEPAK
jgi:hypothetical protein